MYTIFSRKKETVPFTCERGFQFVFPNFPFLFFFKEKKIPPADILKNFLHEFNNLLAATIL